MPRKVSNKVKKIKKIAKVLGKGAYYPGGRVLAGKGGFFDDIGGALKGIAGPALGLLGGALDSVIPGASAVTGGIRKLAGLGAYTPVRANAILAQPVPKVGSSVDQGIRYHHEEYLGDITSSEDWELTQFHVNPGLPECFPWLSTIAANFQKYRIDGLVFYVRSTSSVAISNSTDLGLGTILGAYQYNVYDTPPASKVDMMSLSGSLSGKPSEDHIYPLECAPAKGVMTNRLVRHTGVSDDLAKYDHATFNLATVGFPGVYALGELWVSYNILLMAPKVEDALPFLHNGIAASAQQTRLLASGQSHLGWSWDPLTLQHASSTDFMNTLGWSQVNWTDGLPCWQVPAGTNGYYQVSYAHASTGTMFSTSGTMGCTVLDGGTMSLISVPSTIAAVNTATLMCGSQVYNIQGVSDRPLKFRFTVPLNDAVGIGGSVTWNSNFCIVRLSDRWLPDATTGVGTVAPRVKVVRSRNAAITSRLTASVLSTSPSVLGLAATDEAKTS